MTGKLVEVLDSCSRENSFRELAGYCRSATDRLLRAGDTFDREVARAASEAVAEFTEEGLAEASLCRWDSALEKLRHATRIAKFDAGNDSESYAMQLELLGTSCLVSGAMKEGWAVLRDALFIREEYAQAVGAGDVANGLREESEHLERLHQDGRQTAIAGRDAERTIGPYVGSLCLELEARMDMGEGKYVEALQAIGHVVETTVAHFGSQHRRTAHVLVLQAEALWRLGDLERAATVHAEAVKAVGSDDVPLHVGDARERIRLALREMEVQQLTTEQWSTVGAELAGLQMALLLGLAARASRKLSALRMFAGRRRSSTDVPRESAPASVKAIIASLEQQLASEAEEPDEGTWP